MKKNLLQSFAVISIFGGLIFWGSFARAWTYPSAVPPAGNVVTPINTGIVDQTKTGKLFNKDAFISPWGFFSNISLPAIITSNGYLHPNLTIGGLGSSIVNLSTSNSFSRNIPLAIDLKNRPTSNAIEVYSDQSAACPINKKVTLVADTAPAFQLWNARNNQNADLIARQVQLTGGSPGVGKVLTSDNAGNASWGTVNMDALNGRYVPDIKMVFARFDQSRDGDSDTVFCPPYYAAVSVACDSTGDRGHDTCRINHNYPNGSAITIKGLGANNDLATTATVSRSGTVGNVDVSIWLTCMRYKNFPPVNPITAGTSPVATGQQCAAPPTENWIQGKTCTGLSYEIPNGYSRARVVFNDGGVLKYYYDTCLVREKIQTNDPTKSMLCHAVPVGEGSGTYNNETITTSCTDTAGNNDSYYQEFLKE